MLKKVNSNPLESLNIVRSVLDRTYWYNNPMIVSEKFKSIMLNRVIKLYDNIEKKEDKKVFLIVIENLDVYSLNDYKEMIQDIYIKIQTIASGKKIIICPLIEEQKGNTIKSGHFVSYLFKTFDFSFLDDIHGYNSILKITGNLTPEILDQFVKEDAILIFLDDFVGTGRTAIRVYNSYINRLTINKNNAYIASLVTLEKGMENIKNEGINYLYSRKSRCINDLTNDEEIIENFRKSSTRLAKKITSKKYISGYGQSEGLTVMYRTPNNTVPYIWKNNKKNKTLFYRSEV